MSNIKGRAENQALFQHALYFDPINQPRFPGSDERFRPGVFENVPGARTLPNGDVEVTY